MTNVFEKEVGMIDGLLARLSSEPTKPRGFRREDSEEKFLDVNIEEYRNQLGIIHYWANVFAQESLGTVALNPSPLLLTKYIVGQSMDEHVDQYVRGANWTLNRTVSATFVVEQADEGGALVIQDRERLLPARKYNPPAGTLLLWPADWWRFVTRVKRGRRRSLVCWWNNGTEYEHATASPDTSEEVSWCGGNLDGRE